MAAKRKQWSDVSMAAAVEQVQKQELSLREASRLYNIPLETLRRRVNGTVAIDCRPGPRTVLTEDEETKLADYLLQMSEMGYGLTREGVMGMAYSIVERSKRPHPFQNGSAGRAWFEGFMRRKPYLTIRSPQSLSYCRAISANKVTINDFFGKLGSLYGKLNLISKPMQIYNCDETGVTVVFKPNKVIAELGKKHVYAISAAERGKTHTILSCVSATGFMVPPMIIYPRKTCVPDKLKEGAFPNTLFKNSESGWINSELFVEWFTFFLKSIPPVRPVLLVQDGHSSHVCIELIEMARANDVCLLCLPAHTSHILQPLDVGVFKSFKSNFNKACGNYMKQNPGRVITTDILASMVGQAYPTAFTPVNILSGFKKTGIYPFNPSSVDDRQLAPSNALSTLTTTATSNLPEQPLPEDVPSDKQPVLFSPEKEKRFTQRFEEGYNILDEEYIAWVRINHPEHCLSVGSSSNVSATSGTNHMLASKTSSCPSSLDQQSKNDILSDILVLPKPKDKSGRKRKAGINQKTVCLTDDEVFDGLKAEDQKKKENKLKRIEREQIREKKKAEKERLKKEKEEKKKQKELAKQARMASDGPEELDRMLSGLTLDGNDSDDAVCPKCGLLYSADEENLWVYCDKCSSWYDFKCTELRSERYLPPTYICDSCKKFQL